MKTGLRRHLTPGNAIAMAALLVALGGTAVAQVALPDGSVTTASLNNGAVTAAKIANRAVKSAKIADTAVKTAKIADGAVTSKKIATGAVTSAKIANSAVTSADIKAGTITSANIAAGVLGGLSSSKVTVVNGPQAQLTEGATATAVAVCPAGQRAISGGYDLGQSGVVRAAGPTQDGQGWSVRATAQVVTATIQATAVCVAP